MRGGSDVGKKEENKAEREKEETEVQEKWRKGGKSEAS